MEDQEVMLAEQSEALRKLHDEKKIAQDLVEQFQVKTTELEGTVGTLKESLAVSRLFPDWSRDPNTEL